jgi:hypothetical protein
LVRIARNTPAIATTPSDTAIARAKTWLISRPSAGDLAIVGGGAKAAERRPVEKELQTADHRHRDEKHDQRQDADVDTAADGKLATSIGRRLSRRLSAVNASRARSG